jgi:membrane protein implicated in regulation of membrane protease activity
MSRNRAKVRPREAVEWNFNSFPTYFAFAAGVFTATALIFYVNFYVDLLLILSLFAVSYGLIHIATRAILRQRRRHAGSKQDEEERERRIYAARAAANAEAAPAPRKRRRRR